MKLIVKRSNPKGRKVVMLPPPPDEELSVSMTWQLLLSCVEKEFNIHRDQIRLSLNHGKTFIKADDMSLLEDVGVVNGDILTLVCKEAHITGGRSTSTVPESRLTHIAESSGANGECDVPTTSMETDSYKKLSLNIKPHMTNWYMNTPMLLMEATLDRLPPTFTQRLLDNPTDNSADVLVLALHTLLIESNFIIIEDATYEGNLLKQIRLGSTLYKMKYSHSIHTNCVVNIAGVVLRNQLVVHGVVAPSGNLSIRLPIENFISGGVLSYSNLADLSRLFKDDFVMPLLIAVMEALNKDPLIPVLKLPYELHMAIFIKLDFRSLCRVGRTCNQMSLLYKDNTLWRRLFSRRYRNRGGLDCSIPTDSHQEPNFWYQKFKNLHLSDASLRRPRLTPDRQGVDRFPFPRVDPVFPLLPFGDDPLNVGIPHPLTGRRMRHDDADGSISLIVERGLVQRPESRNVARLRTSPVIRFNR